MKKKLTGLLLAAAAVLSLCAPAGAASQKVLALKIGSNRMVQSSQVYQVDSGNSAVVPIVQNDRTLVPASQIVKMFGGASSWNGEKRIATFTRGDHTVKVLIDGTVYIADGQFLTMEVAPQIINDRTYVPLRAVLEGLGLTVGYEASNRVIVVSDGALDQNDLASLSEVKSLLLTAGSSGQETPSGQGSSSGQTASGTMIAPARSRADMAPDHGAGCVQDLSPATGFLFTYKNQNYSFNHGYIYEYPLDTSHETVRSELKAYVDILAALPGFELVRPWGPEDQKDDHYYAWLNYTAASPRMKGNYQTFSDGEYMTVHVDVAWNVQFNEVSVFLDDNLSYADLGRRTAGGAGLSTQQIFGDRAGDAYYLDKGTYYNAGDRKLSTTSGKAALLIDGRPYTGTVTFKTSSKDILEISGYYRSDSIGLSFATDWTVTGDVYGLDDLRYGYRQPTSGPYICVNYGSDNQWSTPLADPDREVHEATVRVLRWDKSGGDTVIYFFMKAEVAGQLYDIEGLAAAPWTDSKRPGSSSSSEDGDCDYCGGDGVCPVCDGSGTVSNRLPGTTTYLEQNCTDCYDPGKCRICHGTGRK